ncbi:hypothetical protein CK203_009789 [Vitis vinifera]|uniref:Uncharacterized protein n=1 Tax=Vitis vinifera TaxID=29760 RepID=A0A438JVD4_VITVI|nr:hypothetical protein CK203_009789 [Vitis vinifera]
MKNRENRKISATSPEKEDRYYTTRGSMGMMDDNGKVLMDHGGEDRGTVWPKLFISLSSKEKEEDFMAMKGCAWLSDLCQERYEVREKKASKKRPRGLKAMGSMESDSE